MDPGTREEIYKLHANLCKALADPKRLLLINALRDDARTVSDLAEFLGMSQSNVSQHLGMLRERGVVKATRIGNNVSYQLENRKVVQAIDLLREVMAEQLAARSDMHKAVTAG